MQNTLAIISCKAGKQSYKCSVREMYWPSALFRKQVEFVENHYSSWAVLSAKYGLVFPTDIIEPYNLTLTSNHNNTMIMSNYESLSSSQKKEWAENIKESLLSYLNSFDQIDAYVSQAYAFALKKIPQIRLLKVNAAGPGLFKSLSKWSLIANSKDSVEDLISQRMLISLEEKGDRVPSSYSQDVRKEVIWVHATEGLFQGSSLDLAKKYGLDSANLKNVAIGRAKSSYGWKLYTTEMRTSEL